MYEIFDIYWERVNLHIKLNKKIKEKVYLKSEEANIELPCLNDEIIINITNTPEGTMLNRGIWQIYINDEPLKIKEKLINHLEDKSRIFPYRKDFYAYIINFFIEDENLTLKIKTDFMMKNKKPQKFFRLQEAKNINEFLKLLIQKFGIITIKIIYRFFHILNNKKNILLLSENSSRLTGNLKCVYNDLIKHDYKIYVYTKNKYKEKYSILNYIKEIYLIAKSKIIIVDNYTSILTHINLTKDTKIIQLWHAGIGFKSVGYARFGLKSSPHPYQSSHRKYTYIIVDDERLINIYQEVFGCKKEVVLPLGMPRMNNFLDKSTIEYTSNKLYKKNPNLKNHKVILFAPTFRGEGQDDAFYDISKINLDEIYKFCKKKEAIFIIKMHPFIGKLNLNLAKYGQHIIDYSDYDINELLYITDVLITDYSSCAYEYSFFNRPLILYRYDKILYEYLRPPHTIDLFTNNRYEVKTFEEMMKVINNLKIDINKRYESKNINRNNYNIEKIIESIIGAI